MENGKKFHQTARELARVKEYSNKLCQEYGLSVTEVKSSAQLYHKWKDMLIRKAFSIANLTRSKEEFIWEMEMHGYTADGKFVILHDSSLNRTVRDADGNAVDLKISEITLAQAQSYDYGSLVLRRIQR